METITKERVLTFVAGNSMELIATHTRLCVPIINRIYRKMRVGMRFNKIKAADGLICDGHHRYLASLLANASIERMPGIKTSATKVIEWESVVFEEHDWDSPTKIKLLNQHDAEYNNIPLEILLERINKNTFIL